MDNVDVFSYSDPHEFLHAVLKQKQARNPNYSIRAWSRQLGYKNPAFFSQVLKEQRKLNLELAQKISAQLGFSKKETSFFETLIACKNTKSVAEREIYLEELEKINPSHRVFSLELDSFRFIADWYHVVILEMLALKSFRNSAKWIVKCLQQQVSEQMVEAAIERMQRIGIIKRIKQKIIRSDKASLIADYKIPHEAVRKHHLQMIEQAKKSVDSLEMDERELLSSTIGIAEKDIPKAKKIMKECHQKILKLSRSESCDTVMQFNSQFFPIIKRPKEDKK